MFSRELSNTLSTLYTLTHKYYSFDILLMSESIKYILYLKYELSKMSKLAPQFCKPEGIFLHSKLTSWYRDKLRVIEKNIFTLLIESKIRKLSDSSVLLITNIKFK